MSYQEFFNNLNMFGIKLGLEKVKLLFEMLEIPQNKIHFIHIAGTNGKGSVAALTSAKLSMLGFKTGLYTSPHLISIRERFRIDGKAVSKFKLEKLCREIQPIIDSISTKTGSPPSYFEVTTALAAQYFSKEKVKFAVWETGMGGRLDATNTITPEISVITSIDLDHTAYLGTTKEEIATEKAGIIKKGVPLICGDLSESTEAVITKKARELNCKIYFPLKKKSSQNFNEKNNLISEEIINVLKEKRLIQSTRKSINVSNLCWPARFQILKNNIIVDGAHNPQGTSALVQLLNFKFPNNKFTIIFASFNDKNIKESLKILSKKASKFIFTEAGIARKTAPPEQIAEIFNELPIQIPFSISKTPENALNIAGEKNILITGSLYLAGDILKFIGLKNNTLNIY